MQSLKGNELALQRELNLARLIWKKITALCMT